MYWRSGGIKLGNGAGKGSGVLGNGAGAIVNWALQNGLKGGRRCTPEGYTFQQSTPKSACAASLPWDSMQGGTSPFGRSGIQTPLDASTRETCAWETVVLPPALPSRFCSFSLQTPIKKRTPKKKSVSPQKHESQVRRTKSTHSPSNENRRPLAVNERNREHSRSRSYDRSPRISRHTKEPRRHLPAIERNRSQSRSYSPDFNRPRFRSRCQPFIYFFLFKKVALNECAK